MRSVVRVLTALAVSLAAVLIPSSAQAATGTTFTGVYVSTDGSRAFRGYVPSTYRAGTAMPLVVALHGCTQTGYGYETLTGWNDLAEQKGFIVVYPSQSILANLLLCWNWDQSANQHRGKGEPAIIAGITWYIRDHYSVDPNRIFATGASAGGVMANIMAVTYPDVFAAASLFAGCEYLCDPTATMTPEQSGQAALTEMGSRARAVPTVIWQGTADTTVPPSTAARIVGQWATVDGIDAVADTTELGQVPNGRSYTHYAYTDSAGRGLIEEYLIDGEGHQYPGGCSCGIYGDPSGPDGTSLSWDFFAAHPMP